MRLGTAFPLWYNPLKTPMFRRLIRLTSLGLVALCAAPSLAWADFWLSADDTTSGAPTQVRLAGLQAGEVAQLQLLTPTGLTVDFTVTADDFGTAQTEVYGLHTTQPGTYTLTAGRDRVAGDTEFASFQVTSDGPSAHQSTLITLDSSAPADNRTVIPFTLQLRDRYGQPSASRDVRVFSSRQDTDTVAVDTYTDTHGVVRGTVRSSSPGLSILTAIVDGTVITQQPELFFFADARDPAAFGRGQADTTLGQFLTAQLFEEDSLAYPEVSFLKFDALPTSVKAGEPVTFRLTSVDSSFTPVPTYTGTVRFSSTDNEAKLPTDYTFTLDDQGVHEFGLAVTFYTAGTQTLRVDGLDDLRIFGEVNVEVEPSNGSTGPTAPPDDPTQCYVTINSPRSGTYKSNRLTVAGSSSCCDSLKLIDGDRTLVPQITPTSDGSFIVQTPTLEDGPHDLQAICNTDATLKSDGVDILIDRTPPAALAVEVQPTGCLEPGQAFTTYVSSSEQLSAARCTFQDIVTNFQSDGQRFYGTFAAPLQPGTYPLDCTVADNLGNELSQPNAELVRVCSPGTELPDTDGDGAPDITEMLDDDGDGVPNYLESNTADDDGDGTTNEQDPDTPGTPDNTTPGVDIATVVALSDTTLTVTISNESTTQATEVTGTILLPQGLTANPTDLTLNLSQLSPGESTDVTIPVSATPDTCVSGAIMAQAFASQADYDLENNADTTSVTLGCADTPTEFDPLPEGSTPPPSQQGVDVATTITPTPTGVTVTLTNLGTQPATGVSSTVELPLGLTAVDPLDLVLALGTLAPGAEQTIQIPTIETGCVEGTVTATAQAQELETTLENNTSQAEGKWGCGQAVDLQATVTQSAPDTLTLTITNLSDTDATGVTVQCHLAGATYTAGDCQWAVGLLPAGQNVTRTVPFTLAPADCQQLHASVTASATQSDRDPSNNANTTTLSQGTCPVAPVDYSQWPDVPPSLLDSDADGILDLNEINDQDQDGIPDYLESSVTDSTGNGTPDQSDPFNDYDSDTIPNIDELTADTSPFHAAAAGPTGAKEPDDDTSPNPLQGVAPSAVTGLTASCDETDDQKVWLTWLSAQPVTQVSSYRVAFGQSGLSLSGLNVTPDDRTRWYVEGLVPGTPYDFTVTALTADGLAGTPTPVSGTPGCQSVNDIIDTEIPTTPDTGAGGRFSLSPLWVLLLALGGMAVVTWWPRNTEPETLRIKL